MRAAWALAACRAAAAVPTLQMFAPMTVPVAVAEPNGPDWNITSTWLDVTSPSGGTTRVFPFRTRNFSRSQDAAGGEVLEPAGAPFYAARFTCLALGAHAFAQRGAPPAGAPPAAGAFECVAPAAPDGFAAVDAAHGQYFVTVNASGATPFWLVGENMGWAGVWPYFNGSAQFSNGTGGTYMFDRYLAKLAAAGGNYIRLWACPSLFAEPTWDGEAGSFLGLGLAAAPFGSYDLAAAWRLDYLFERTRALGIKVNLVVRFFREPDGPERDRADPKTLTAARTLSPL